MIGLGLGLAGGAVTTAASPATTAPEVGEPAPPTGLGDDPALNALAQSCFDGDLESCDDLYWRTEVGSAYEDYGSTCGGRLTEAVFGGCVDTIESAPGDPGSPTSTAPPPTEEPTGLGTDPDLDALAADCYAGAMFACDKLFVLGDEGTPYYSYGYTCAGRQADDVGTYCHELVGFPGPGVDFSALPTPESDDLYAMIAACAIGDMQSCDDLYRQVDETSPYQSLADTCAGRQAEDTGQLCVSAFPAWEQLLVVPEANSTPADPIGDVGTATDPAGLGDDPTFNALAESCFEGDLASCDDLYRRSPIGSDYETYGSTCGGRVAEPTNGGCGEGLESTAPIEDGAGAPTIEPTGLGSDPALDALAEDCYAGAMFACDKLYFDADAETDAAYSEFADSCAGRQAVDTGLYCHELVGFPAPTSDMSTLPLDDPQLFLDASLCAIGDMVACDDIYRAVPDGSPYQEFADTCAGRQEVGTGTYCTAAFPEYERLYEADAATPTEPGPTTTTGTPPGSGDMPPPSAEPTGLGSDPAMDALAQSCYDGDMQACDDLYMESPLDSAYESYGDTCAGRQPPETGTYCADTFSG